MSSHPSNLHKMGEKTLHKLEKQGALLLLFTFTDVKKNRLKKTPGSAINKE